MRTNAKTIPDGFHTVTPYLTVKNAVEAIEFYERAFGARERLRLDMPDGKVGHAELVIGNSIVMLADEFPECGNQSPQTLGSPVGFAVYVDDADRAMQRAIDAGATVKEPISDKFYGDRAGSVTDPFGYKWMLMTHIEDVSPEEVKRRMAEMFGKAEVAESKG